MPNKISHSGPTIDKKDIAAVVRVLRSNNIAQGLKISEFEKKFAQFQKCKGAVAVNSGTSALHLALLALDIKKGDEVIMPTFVCTALLNAVNYVEARPKIVDIDDDFNISYISTKKAINKRTKAIIVPHMFGKPAEIKSLLKFKVPIIEDCAQAFGAKIGNTRVGNFGIISIFSFYATKVMTTGEGGMVASGSIKLLNKIKDLRDYDNKADYKVRYNYKMTDMQAALGISQLKKLPLLINKRKQIAEFYTSKLKNSGFLLPEEKKEEEHIYFRYVIKTKTRARTLIKKLNKKGICAALPIFKPLHQYFNSPKCKNADRLYNNSVSVPIYPNLKERMKVVNGLLKINI